MSKPARITETDFMGQVIDFAHLHGWMVAHFRPMRRRDGTYETPCQADAMGFPDLFMVRPETGHRVAAELKTGKNRVSEDQDKWLDAMERAGIPAYIWTPNDWPEIEETLQLGPK